MAGLTILSDATLPYNRHWAQGDIRIVHFSGSDTDITKLTRAPAGHRVLIVRGRVSLGGAGVWKVYSSDAACHQLDALQFSARGTMELPESVIETSDAHALCFQNSDAAVSIGWALLKNIEPNQSLL